MAKLTCTAHHRRVITGEKSFLHRTGDNSACDSIEARIGLTSISNFVDIRDAGLRDLELISEKTSD